MLRTFDSLVETGETLPEASAALAPRRLGYAQPHRFPVGLTVTIVTIVQSTVHTL